MIAIQNNLLKHIILKLVDRGVTTIRYKNYERTDVLL